MSVAAVASPAREAAARPVEIRVRPMGKDYADTPDFWFDNDPFLSMFFTAFSATLPDGEKQFIHSVRLFQDRIKDPVLREEIRAFIGQEAHHAKEHDTFNRLMADKGYSIPRIEKRMKAMFKWFRDNLSPEEQLANTVCAEHFTALMADYMLSTAPERLALMDESMQKLWAWHAIEEAEHKGVAFDVYAQEVGDTWLRRRTMVLLTASIVLVTSYDAVRLMKEAGELGNLRSWRKGLGFMLGNKGMVWSMAKDYFDFYRADFHPWQQDNRKALARARAKYLGEKA